MIEIVSIQFDNTDNTIYKTLAEKMEQFITNGQIKSGERLPAVRKMAKELKINTSTVIAAYRYLEEQGFVYTKAGSGTYCLPPVHNTVEEETEHFDSDYTEFGSGKITISEKMINLAGNSPTAGVFPVADFKNAMNQVLDSDGGYAFSYQESEGYWPLRERLCSFTKQNYQMECTPETIIITSGAQQALDLITKAFLQTGDTVLAEMPSYIGMHSIFALRGAKIVGVPMEKDGLNLDVLEYYAKRYNPKFLYSMPIYQTPTGICLSYVKRKKLLELAEKYNFYIIEDDLFSDINLSGDRLFPLKQQDKDDRVIYIKSFSKLMMPGIRTGYVIAPRKLFDKMTEAKYATDISGSGFIQRALTVYFQQGCWNKNIENLTKVYKERLKITENKALQWKKLGVDFSEVKGGFGFWLTLPDGITDKEIYYKCKENQVLIAPGSSFYVSPASGFEQHLRISFASTDELEKGLNIVGTCLKESVNRNSKHTIFI